MTVLRRNFLKIFPLEIGLFWPIFYFVQDFFVTLASSRVLTIGELPPALHIFNIMQISFRFRFTTTLLAVLYSMLAFSANAQQIPFHAWNETWPNEVLPVPDTGYIFPVGVSGNGMIIQKPTWSDTVHFKLAVNSQGDSLNSFPDTLFGEAGLSVLFAYFPDSVSHSTQVTWTGTNFYDSTRTKLVTFDTLTGPAIDPVLSFISDTTFQNACDEGGWDNLLLWSEGTSPVKISHIIQRDGNDTIFQPLRFYQPNGGSGDSNFILPVGQVLEVNITWNWPIRDKDTLFDSIYVYDWQGNLFNGKPTIIRVIQFEKTLSAPAKFDMGTVTFGSPNDSATIFITNDSIAPVFFQSFSFEQIMYSSEFSATTVPSLPDSVHKGDTVRLTIHYDASVSDDSLQSAQLYYATDACGGGATLVTVHLADAVVSTPQLPASVSVIPLADGQSIEIVPPQDPIEPMTFQLFNLPGETVFSQSISRTRVVNVGHLPRSMYLYRIMSGQQSQIGKLLLGQ